MTTGDKTSRESNVEELIDQLKNNDLFTEFLSDGFDPREYANTIIESHLIGESLSRLADGISLLNKELMTQVSEHHEDLLLQATGIDKLEGVLQSIQSRCLSLVKSVERVKGQVTDPYNRIASRTRQLRRLQTTCDYLRRIIRILSLSRRLETQRKGGSREITKAAQSLNELSYVTEGVDLSGIQIIEEDLKKIKESQVEVENQAKKMLEQGLNTQNQTLIGTALQVFHNLGSLRVRVDDIISHLTDQVEKFIYASLDAKSLATSQGMSSGVTSGPGRAAMPTAGNTASWRTALWEHVEKLMNNLYNLCQKIFTLEKVLLKKRDPITHITFIEMFSENGQSILFSDFWNVICSTLRSEFDHSTQASTHLKQAFQGEFPKLLRLFNDFWSQISALADSKHTQSSQPFAVDIKIGFHDDSSPLDSLKATLHPFENAYLSRSLSRLFDSINLVFPNGAESVPTKDELNSIIHVINSELNVASVDEHLMVMISKNVSKTIQLYVNKCEELLVTSPDAAQLSGGLTTSQIRNASIVNSLHQLRTGVMEILPNLVYPPAEAVDVLDDSLTNISSYMDLSLGLILSAIMGSLQNKIARMQSENFSISSTAYHETVDAQPCSRYVADIQKFINRIQSDYLALYNCKDFLIERLEMLACRILELFVRHACLLRDISEGGKLKMAADMAQLEFAVTPLCRRFEDLGAAYKLFRAFRPLLFQAIEDIPTNPNLGESLPYSVVLHFLFSKAPSNMQSPHTVAGWTVPEYSEWLDEHPDEGERIALIRGTVEAYSKKVGGTDLPVVYPVMTKLLEQTS
ncbi:conserved oligomeric Golgi complex subunit 5-like isoform X1 [Hydractinia symbiolongicarpus]|uniref:conserved oligomeric Golgi complex subunit 5-like isoform X1 n=1 Tax=Hydractinia symbiolongicarpus TaxID=13093 RepID=UPI00254F034A|nr:conserved oligomeric Golgi complex subunit 5-like isoform X1 [Hydractinia symbiolongicarpus]